jgi:hypothetical protein
VTGALEGLALGLALGVPLLLAVLWVNSRVSGWSRLAARYAWDGEAEGPRFSWISVGFGWFSWYNNCLTVTATPRGLALRLKPWVRFFHPPLLIPWDRIAAAEPWGSGLMASVALRVEPDDVRVMFKQRQYFRMQGAFPERLRLAA